MRGVLLKTWPRSDSHDNGDANQASRHAATDYYAPWQWWKHWMQWYQFLLYPVAPSGKMKNHQKHGSKSTPPSVPRFIPPKTMRPDEAIIDYQGLIIFLLGGGPLDFHEQNRKVSLWFGTLAISRWWLNHPMEKYARQVGFFSPEIKMNMLKNHHLAICSNSWQCGGYNSSFG